jgi:hypothetical protein
MPKYRTVEVTSRDAAREQVDHLTELMNGLKAKGFKDDLIERIAIATTQAASSWLDGCKGVENPATLVSIPATKVGP